MPTTRRGWIHAWASAAWPLNLKIKRVDIDSRACSDTPRPPMSSPFHLAVFNVGRTVAPLESDQLRAFMDGLDPINALAEGTPGFVWRYVAEGTNNATAARPMD